MRRDRDAFVMEFDATGHRLLYVRLLLDAVDAKFVTSPSVLASQEFQEILAPLNPRTHVVAKPTISAIGGLLGSASILAIPDGDRMLWRAAIAAVARPRDAHRLRLLLLRDYSSIASRPRRLAKRLLIGLLDSFGAKSALLVQDQGDVHSRTTCLVDPPLVSSQVLSRALEHRLRTTSARSGRISVGVFGAITDRKGLPLIAAACAHMDADLRIVGSVSATGAKDLALARQEVGARLSVLDRFVTDDELLTEMATVDVCAVVHTNAGPSGIANLARLIGVPLVLGGRASVLARCGETAVPEPSVEALAEAFRVASVKRAPAEDNAVSDPTKFVRFFFKETSRA